MATLEKRVEDLEYIIAHLPDDLDARFAGVDVKLATIREAQTLHTQRFSTLELKVDGLERKVAGVERKVDGLEHKVDGLDAKVDNLERKVDNLEGKVDGLAGQLTEVLNRLPPKA
jgi:chromosome segregation ATPase